MRSRLLVLLLALAGSAILAPSAGAASRTLGSPLAQAPNAFGCETQPGFFDEAATARGDYSFAPSNQPDCTWWQDGVPGSVDYSDPRTGSVPGDGRITQVAVRSGPNPAAMKFVIVRHLFAQGTGVVCCFHGGETQVVRPAPNSVTTFAVNMPVERNTNPRTGVVTADWIGVTAGTGTGQLPLASNGRHNTINDAGQIGNPQAGFTYPGLRPTPQTSSGQRSAQIPGMEVLLQWTWCATGDTTCAASSGTPVPMNPNPDAGSGGGGTSQPGQPPAPVGTTGATAGSDSLSGTDNDELLCGLGGADTIAALAGNDIVFGDACNDKAKLTGAQASSDGNDNLSGGAGNDTLYGAGGRDTIAGGTGNDKVIGGDGNDKLTGGAGNDTLTGGKGTNSYKAGAGRDKVNARNGKRETVDCGSGRDTATVDKRDKVKGCEKVKRARR